MHQKNKLLSLIVILVISNIYFVYNSNSVKKEVTRNDQVMLGHADRAIDEAVKYIATLSREWDDISNAKKMEYLGDVDRELYLAMHMMDGAGKFFLPLKTYRNGIYIMEFKILNQEDPDIQKDYLEGLYNDFNILWKFLAENRISEISKDEAREKWKSVVGDLETEEFYRNYQ